MTDLQLASPTITRALGDAAFAAGLLQGPSPIFEDVDGQLLMTIIREYVEADEPATVNGSFAQGGGSANRLARIGESPVVYRTWSVPRDLLTTYSFSLRDPLLTQADLDAFEGTDWETYSFSLTMDIDARNPQRFDYPLDPGNDGDVSELRVAMTLSVARGPEAADISWASGPIDVSPLTEHRVRSVSLGDERRVWTYSTDPGNTDTDVAVFMDGGEYAVMMRAHQAAAMLRAAGRIPPLTLVFVHYPDDRRNAELEGNTAYAEFFAGELIPWIRSTLGLTAPAERWSLGGCSNGGLFALWFTGHHPHLIGRVLSQSGNLGHDDNAPIRAWEKPHAPHRFYFDVGSYESVSALTRKTAADLESRGHRVTLVEYPGGHDFLAWRSTIPGGLLALFG